MEPLMVLSCAGPDVVVDHCPSDGAAAGYVAGAAGQLSSRH